MAFYKTLRAIVANGERAPKGAIIDIDKDTVKRYGPKYVVEASKAEADLARAKYGVNEVEPITSNDDDATGEDTTEEIDLTKLSKDELVKLAKERDLPTSGSKADLIDRIALAAEAEEESDEETDSEDQE